MRVNQFHSDQFKDATESKVSLPRQSRARQWRASQAGILMIMFERFVSCAFRAPKDD